MKHLMENKIQKTIRSRRAVAPIIATLLLIAIAVIGGVMIYVFTQGFFGNSAISSSPSADTITMSGYDMRETADLSDHEGTDLTNYGDDGDPGMTSGEQGAIYLRNVGQKDYSISKLEVNGLVMTFDGTDPYPAANNGSWGIWALPDSSQGATLDWQDKATILPGDTATIVVTFEDNANDAAIGRTIPVTVTSASGSVFHFNVVTGAKA